MLISEQIEQFQQDGFLIFDPALSESQLDEAVVNTGHLYLSPNMAPDTSGAPIPYRDARRLQDAWRVSAAVKSIATCSAVIALLQGLYRRVPMPFQTLNFRVGSEQRPHSDTIHFNSLPQGFMCGVWLALEDVDLDNGPVVYFPGTHRFPEVNMADVLGAEGHGPNFSRYWLSRLVRKRCLVAEPDPQHYLRYEECIEAVIRESGVEPRYATLRKGQAFLWAANLLHGGSLQKDRTRTRHSQVTHYFFSGCRYYTPLHSRGRQLAMRHPARIE